MNSWVDYIKIKSNSDLWGFILLDYYNRSEKKHVRDYKSKFLNNVVKEIPKSKLDPVKFHKVYLSVCVHLFGNSFEEIIGKSLDIISEFGKRINDEMIDLIAEQYIDYGKKEEFLDKVKQLFKSSDAAKLDKSKKRVGRAARKDIKMNIKVFYSYSTKDEKLRDILEEHLSLLNRSGYISEWHFRKITAGKEFDREISENLKTSQIILLLVSSSFIKSDYCYEKEMKYALRMHSNKKARVIPVILRDCDWQSAPFGKLVALPKDGKAVTGRHWKNTAEAFTSVAKGIHRVVDEIRELE